MNGKQIKLKESLEAVLSNPSGESLFRLVRTSSYVLRPAEGLIWSEIIDVVEEVTKDDLTHLRPPTCPKCGGGLNMNKKCVNMLCKD